MEEDNWVANVTVIDPKIPRTASSSGPSSSMAPSVRPSHPLQHRQPPHTTPFLAYLHRCSPSRRRHPSCPLSIIHYTYLQYRPKIHSVLIFRREKQNTIFFARTARGQPKIVAIIISRILCASSGVLQFAAHLSNISSILKTRFLASFGSEADDISLTISSVHSVLLAGVFITVT